jgi:hypothetical protein
MIGDKAAKARLIRYFMQRNELTRNAGKRGQNGLKIPWGKPCAGSSPAVRTSKIIKLTDGNFLPNVDD